MCSALSQGERNNTFLPAYFMWQRLERRDACRISALQFPPKGWLLFKKKAHPAQLLQFSAALLPASLMDEKDKQTNQPGNVSPLLFLFLANFRVNHKSALPHYILHFLAYCWLLFSNDFFSKNSESVSNQDTLKLTARKYTNPGFALKGPNKNSRTTFIDVFLWFIISEALLHVFKLYYKKLCRLECQCF